MEQRAHQAFHQGILEQAILSYGGDPSRAIKLAESESVVYEVWIGNVSRILRLTPELHRNANQIQGEIDWISRLRENGVNVACPVQNQSGRLMEPISGDSMDFYAVAFEKAPGQSAQPSDWSVDFATAWGKFVGRMHQTAYVRQVPNQLSESFGPFGRPLCRPVWHEEYNVQAINLLSYQSDVVRQHQAYLGYLQSLPCESDGYGIVHSDFETENFFVEGGVITAFDFDECQFHWYVYDIASILRQASWTVPNLSNGLTLQSFYDAFMNGYAQEHTLSRFWLEQIPKFVQWRDICMYVFSHGKQNPSQWPTKVHQYFQTIRERIARDEPMFTLLYV